jgi:hypothetical protein
MAYRRKWRWRDIVAIALKENESEENEAALWRSAKYGGICSWRKPAMKITRKKK